eukprot:gene14632-31136_t
MNNLGYLFAMSLIPLSWLFMLTNSYSHFNSNILNLKSRLDLSLNAKKQSNVIQSSPEFSRILNIANIPARRPVLCKILAKDTELQALARRLDTYSVQYLAANVTVQRENPSAILVEGSFEAYIKDGEFLDAERVQYDFETLLLDTSGDGAVSFEEATEYDDEVPPSGDVDIGEIVTQYLSLELF